MSDEKDRPLQMAQEDQALLTPEVGLEEADRPVRSFRPRSLDLFRKTARQLEPKAPPPAPTRPPPQDEFEERSQTKLIWWSLVLVVLAPVLVSGAYLFFLSSDQFTSETQFAIRTLTPEDKSDKSDATLPNVLTTVGSPTSQDAAIIADYIQSRAIIDDVSKTIDVRAIFQRPEADFLMRLKNDASIEELTKYWRRMVTVSIENMSGVVTVSVRAFRREDALQLANAVVRASDAMVEELSRRTRLDIVKHAEDEVRRSETQVQTALANLQNYRNSQGLIDPVKSADATGKLLLQLMADKIQTESQLFVSQRTTGVNAPGMAPMRAKLESINGQIANLQEQMTGPNGANANLASMISKFEELDLQRQFSERVYALTQEGLTRARLIADRRAVYLAMFVPPSLPEEYSYPLRYTAFFFIAAAALLTWCCGATIWASILDHKL